MIPNTWHSINVCWVNIEGSVGYGLNICVSPIFTCWNTDPSVFGDGAFGRQLELVEVMRVSQVVLEAKEPTCQCKRHKRCGFDLWVGKIPWRRKWQPTPVFLLENPMDRGMWQATVHRSNSRLLLKRLSKQHAHQVMRVGLSWRA